MDSMASEPGFIDELLNFSSDIEEEEEEDVTDRKRALVSSLRPNGLLLGPRHSVRPWNTHELVEEELEWISNKDAFPAVESFMGVLSDDHPTAAFVASAVKHHSPISVLDTISTSHSSGSSGSLASCFGGMPAPPRRARTNRRGRRRQQWCGGGGVFRAAPEKARKRCSPSSAAGAVISGRKCLHCGAEKTPQWRAGPEGPKTLCNACGVRYKSGRLVPEYRPACSPSFSSELHSNSHRKVVEMRRVKQVMGLLIKQPSHPGYISNKP